MQNQRLKKAAGAEYLPETTLADVIGASQQIPMQERSPNRGPVSEPARRVISDGVINTVIIAAILIVMIVVFQYISRVALLNEYQKQLGRVNASIRDVRHQTAHVDTLIAEAGKVERVEAEARGRLRMREPAPEEIRLIAMAS